MENKLIEIINFDTVSADSQNRLNILSEKRKEQLEKLVEDFNNGVFDESFNSITNEK